MVFSASSTTFRASRLRVRRFFLKFAEQYRKQENKVDQQRRSNKGSLKVFYLDARTLDKVCAEILMMKALPRIDGEQDRAKQPLKGLQ